MGELSAGQALEGASVAPGNRETLNQLQDPVRRPPVMRDPHPAANTKVVSDRRPKLLSRREKVCVESAFIQERCSSRTVGNDGRSFETTVGQRARQSPSVLDGRKIVPSPNTSKHQRDHENGEVDCSPETSRRNCGGCETIGLAHNGSATQQSRGTVHCSPPMCNVDKGRH